MSCSEMWHCKTDDDCLQDSTPRGYSYVEEGESDCYGGVAIFHKVLAMLANRVS